MAAMIEIEAKFRSHDPTEFESLSTAPTLADDISLDAGQTIVDVDTYFDSACFALLRNGYTLRLRQSEDRLVATVKSIGEASGKGVHTRQEIEVPVLDWQPSVERVVVSALLPDAEIDALAPILTRRTKLHALCRLAQTRKKRLVYVTGDAETQPVAELSLDTVEVEQPETHDGVTTWSSISTFHEVEVELLPDADKNSLKRIASILRERPGLVVNEQNKLQCALELLAAQLPGSEIAGVHTQMHMAEYCRLIWRTQLVEMILQETGVRASDDIEYVHQMRVATRRARAAARLFAAFFEDKQVRRYVKELRHTGRLLGVVRDLDVAIERLSRFQDERPPESRNGLGDVEAGWWARRNAAHAELLEWLDSKRYRQFVAQFYHFCATPGAGVARQSAKADQPPPRVEVRHVAPEMLMSRYAVIRSFESLFGSHLSAPAEALHALRIECKYMRYHLEFAAPLLGPEGERLIESLKHLQERLGDLNDAVVSGQMIGTVRRSFDTPALAAYQDRQSQLFEELRSEFFAYFDEFVSLQTRQNLALAIAHI